MENLIKDANLLIWAGNCLKYVVNELSVLYPEFSKIEICRIVLNNTNIDSELTIKK